jgi:hypothetical protein
MSRPVACLTFPDSISYKGCCKYLPNTVVPIFNKVFSIGLPEAGITDVLAPVPCVCICTFSCGPPLFRQILGYSKVITTGRPTAHVGDLTAPVSPT